VKLARVAPGSVTALAVLTILAACAAREPGRPDTAAPARLIAIQNPQPQAGARFGSAVAALDFDGDGSQDVAVGAPGDERAYVFFGPDFEQSLSWRPLSSAAGDQFGFRLASGELNGRPGDELVVGAPGSGGTGGVFVVAQGDSTPRRLPIDAVAGERLGTSLALGDFDGDGALDVAAGAPKALIGGNQSGAVYVLSPATGAVSKLQNPIGSWLHGNYGHDLAAADGDGDGRTDLFVSAVGNRSEAGIIGAGQVYLHLNPVADGGAIVIEEPDPTAGDEPRFGMSIDARDLDGDGMAEALVGAPRKDGGGLIQSGAGFVFRGPDFQSAQMLLSPEAMPEDLLGFRALAADVVGDQRPDAVFCALPKVLPGLVVAWDAGDPALGEIWVAPPDVGHHFVQGLDHGAAAPGSYEPLIMGDPVYDPGGLPGSGRVLVRLSS